MSGLLLLVVAAVVACGSLVLLRLQKCDRELVELLGDDGSIRGNSDRGIVFSAVIDHIESSLLPDANGDGLASIPVRATEPHDRHKNARELLQRIASMEPPCEPRDHEARIKALFQVGHSFGLHRSTVDRLLESALEDVIGQDWMGKQVSSVEQVELGDTIDRETMWPLSMGTRVKYPLGVVIRDQDGKVLSRAKVLCG